MYLWWPKKPVSQFCSWNVSHSQLFFSISYSYLICLDWQLRKITLWSPLQISFSAERSSVDSDDAFPISSSFSQTLLYRPARESNVNTPGEEPPPWTNTIHERGEHIWSSCMFMWPSGSVVFILWFCLNFRVNITFYPVSFWRGMSLFRMLS